MTGPYRLRTASPDDLPGMQRLFAETVRAVCSADYTDDQIRVWASSVEDGERWRSIITRQYVVIAESGGAMAGFGSLGEGCYIDLLYVSKDHQRQGVATAILNRLLGEAARLGHTRLTSDVSITARPFFERHGFRVIMEQRKPFKGVKIVNYQMEKVIDPL